MARAAKTPLPLPERKSIQIRTVLFTALFTTAYPTRRTTKTTNTAYLTRRTTRTTNTSAAKRRRMKPLLAFTLA